MERLAGSIIMLWGWRRAAAALGAGALAILAQPPFDMPLAALAALPVLVWLLDGAAAPAGARFLRRHAPAFATGWTFGFGYFVAGLWWIGNALLFEADAFAWALPIVVLALPAALALFFGLATALAGLCWSNGIGRIAALAAALGFTEWLRSFLFTGFPWNPLGQMAMPAPVLMQSAGVVGAFGMNVLAVLFFALPAVAGGKRHRGLAAALFILLAAAHAGYGLWRLSEPLSPETLDVRIVQPATPLDGAWSETERASAFRKLLALSGEPGKPTLLVWPETAVPFIFSERPDALAAIGDLLQPGQTLMAGAVREEGGGESAFYYNSVVVIGDDGVIQDAADKVHLVPFGEYVPLPALLRGLGIEEIVRTVGGYSAAPERRVLKGPGDRSFVPLICYEAIFPQEVSAAARGADVLVNVTVDTWFGDTTGPWQHLRQAQLRAVETGLPMLRAANSGVSALIDSRGRVIDALALATSGTLDGRLPLAKTQTLTRYSQSLIGVAFMIILAAIACAMNRTSVVLPRKSGA